MSSDGPSRLHPNAEFQVDWPDPDDAKSTWVWDPVHCPHPLTPLSTDFAKVIFREIAASLGLGPAEGHRHQMIFPNGCAYFRAQSPPDPSMPTDPARQSLQRQIEDTLPQA